MALEWKNNNIYAQWADIDQREFAEYQEDLVQLGFQGIKEFEHRIFLTILDAMFKIEDEWLFKYFQRKSNGNLCGFNEIWRLYW